MGWTTLLKGGAKAATWLGKGAKATAETTGKALLHPQTTISGAGTALKTAAVGAGLGYVGWKKITTDESIVGIVSDAVIGEKGTEKVMDAVHGTADGLRDIRDSVSHVTDRIGTAVEGAGGSLGGISTFLSSVSGGRGREMMGNFISNLTHGNVPGLGIAGLVLSAFLLMGRLGWMGRLSGALLAMMMIGGNAEPLTAARTQERVATEEQAETVKRARR